MQPWHVVANKKAANLAGADAELHKLSPSVTELIVKLPDNLLLIRNRLIAVTKLFPQGEHNKDCMQNSSINRLIGTIPRMPWVSPHINVSVITKEPYVRNALIMWAAELSLDLIFSSRPAMHMSVSSWKSTSVHCMWSNGVEQANQAQANM